MVGSAPNWVPSEERSEGERRRTYAQAQAADRPGHRRSFLRRVRADGVPGVRGAADPERHPARRDRHPGDRRRPARDPARSDRHPRGDAADRLDHRRRRPRPPPPRPRPGAPAPTGEDGPSGTSGSTGPEPGDIPQAAAQQGEQETTGKSERRPKADKKASTEAEKAEEEKQTEALEKKAKAKAAEEKATAARDEDGTPTAVNPTYSFAIPGGAPIGVPNFFIEKFRIPPFLLPIYQAAGIQYGIRWEILAAINEIETDYGRNLNVSTAGALGWMQFIPSTWKQYGVDANNDGKKDPYNPVDAIFGAARYLKAAGAEKDISKAIFAYNHAQWYVDSVLMRARLIGGLPADLVGSLTGLTQGHFPVHATARYADDLSEADTKRRIARGKNAAIPVEAEAARKGIDIFAKAGSPVIAVQDATVAQGRRAPSASALHPDPRRVRQRLHLRRA